MTIRTDTPKPAAIAVEGTMPFTPEQIIEQLRILRAHVPDFGPLPVSEAAALTNVARINAEMIHAAIHTVGAAPSLTANIGRGVDDLRADEADVGRWRAVEAELETFLRGVKAANLSRRHRLGLAALQTYNISRQLVRRKEHADLLPHVEAMRRANRFGRRRRDTAETPAVPATAPTRT
jgi:hypothetical protein